MGALNSVGLWSLIGALGVAVPIIIHLLYRKHRRQTDWAAMELLRKALVTRSGQVKIEDLVILILRCLALALLALALMRITLDSNSVIGEERIGMVVAIDASYSMNHGEVSSRFKNAVTQAGDILKETAKEGDPVSIVLMSSRPEVLLRSARYDPAQVKTILDELDVAGPNSLNLETNIELLDELVAELKTPGKEVFLITDSQEMDWAELPPAAQESLENLQENANVFVIPAVNEGEDNLAIEDLTYTWGSLRKSGEARFTALVRNTGRSTAEGATLEFFVDDTLTKRLAVGSLGAGESRPLEFTTQFEKAGDVHLRAELSNDDLADDNVRHAIARIRPGIRVLLLEGDIENTAGNRGGGYYAKVALSPRDSDEDEGVTVNEIDPADFGLEKLNDYDVVAMNNVLTVSPTTAKRLKRFVTEGGGLIIFAGDRVEASAYNQTLGVTGEGILPAELGEVSSTDTEEGWTMEAAKSDHLLARLTARYPEKLLDAIRITKQINATPTEDGEVLITSQSGNPVLLSSTTGSGTVLLFTTSASKRWNNLPREPLYAILLQQAVTMLTSDPDRLQLVVGNDTSLPLAKREAGEFVPLWTPDAEEPEDVRVTQNGDQLAVPVALKRHGVYKIMAEEGKPGVAIAANVNTSESNVRVVEGAALENTLDPTGVEVLYRDGRISKAIRDARQGRELSHRLLLAALIIFILQSILARRFTNRISREDTKDLSATLQMSQVAAARRS